VLVDCNLLPKLNADSYFELMADQLTGLDPEEERLAAPEMASFRRVDRRLSSLLSRRDGVVALLLDGFDEVAESLTAPFFNRMRALRDAHKYQLAYLTATRRPLSAFHADDRLREFQDLFAANILWLGPLSSADARWTLQRVAARHGGNDFEEKAAETLYRLSGGHPGLLRAMASLWPDRRGEDPRPWLEDTAIRRECRLLWEDLPEESRAAALTSPGDDPTLVAAGLAREGKLFSPVFQTYVKELVSSELALNPDTGVVTLSGVPIEEALTAKEFALLSYLIEHAGAVCEKDDLIQAVWSEDQIFEQGLRDDSLAQLIRRARVKIEPEPSQPRYLLTAPGRGYRLLRRPEGGS
jgi:DNA-binding winged helix-turn-helix (wHTH) protein